MARTRFTVLIGTTIKELFSVRESGGGELRIILKHAAGFEDDDGSLVAIKEQRYSIHKSDESLGNTMIQTVLLEDGRKIDTAIFSFAIPNNVFVPLFARRAPDLSLGRYNIPNRPNDTLVALGVIDPGTATLLYLVAVSGHHAELTQAQPFSVTFRDFRLFRVHVLWSFIPMRSLSYEDLRHFATSPPRFDGVPRAGPTIRDHPGASEPELMHETATAFQHLHERMLQRQLANR